MDYRESVALEVHEIMHLLRQGVDFGANATIKTLLTEIHFLRTEKQELEAKLKALSNGNSTAQPE